MYKKTLLSVAIASALSLTGCLDTVDPNNPKEQENAGVATNPVSPTNPAHEAVKNAIYPAFSPASGEFPVPNDLLLQKDDTDTSRIELSDGSYALPGIAKLQEDDVFDALVSNGTISPAEVALENLSGASLSAPIDIEIQSGSAVGSFSIDSDTVKAQEAIHAGTQSVFLIELEYASDNPQKALVNKEKPAPTDLITAQAAQGGNAEAAQALTNLAVSPKYDAKIITRTKADGSTGTYIRINPLVPLNPNKRYVVALTDDIKDTNGTTLVRQPGLAAYDAIRDESRGLADPKLGGIRSLINDLWEEVTYAYLANLTNPQRAADAQLSKDNIIFSISFTTSNDTKVIDYIAEPNAWATDTLKSIVKTNAAKAATDAGAADYVATATAVGTAYNTWVPSSFSAALADCDDTDTYTTADARFACAGATLVGGAKLAGFNFPEPAADTTVSFSNHRNVLTVSAAVSSEIAGTGVNISEGSLSIPYYLGNPVTGEAADVVKEWWKADATLATQINTLLNLDALGQTLPQSAQAAGTVQSDIVNSYFPFPAKTADLEIPVLAIYPADESAKPAEGYTTVIYQHAATADRSAALAIGSAIVKNSGGTVAVLAIDQPLHGIDAISDAGKDLLASKLLTAGQAAGLPTSLASSESNNAALIAGTLATGFVSSTLTASTYVAAALDNASLIDIDNGVDANEAVLINAAFTSTLSEAYVAQTISAAIGGYDPTNLTPTEEAVVNNMVAGTNITPVAALDPLATQMPTLDATSFAVIESLSQTLAAIQSDQGNAQVLVGSAFTGTLLKTYLAFTMNLDPIALTPEQDGLIDLIIAGTAPSPTYDSLMGIAGALASGFSSLQTAAQGLYVMQTTVANGASQIPGLGQGTASERHFGLAGVNLTPTAMDFDSATAVGTSATDLDDSGLPIIAAELSNSGSGALFLNPQNFLATRDNFRQHILDLFTLRLSIDGMDIDETAGADLNEENVHFIAHSVGNFNGIPFVEIANQTTSTADNIASAHFMAPAGNISRTLENSQSLAPSLFYGLTAADGPSRGDTDLESFLKVFQATLDSFDPINFVADLSGTDTLFTEVTGDNFFPNEASPAYDVLRPAFDPTGMPGVSFGSGTDAPLAGTSPLQTISGATSIDSTDHDASFSGLNFVRFAADSGATHKTAVIPLTPEEKPAFAEMVGQVTSAIVRDTFTVTNGALIEDK